MICTSPVQLTQRKVSCGQCMCCRINKKRKWSGRLALECLAWDKLSVFFQTLTYADWNLPTTLDEGLPTLEKKELQTWVKNLIQWARDNGHATPRFFAVGEYGSKTERPHYHIIWFNMETAVLEQAQISWKMGHQKTELVNSPKALAYVCAYTTKKMTRESDERLLGREPEFMISSKRPAIGWPGVEHILKAYQSGNGKWLIDNGYDILAQYTALGKSWPLEYRMAQWLRKKLGIPTLAEQRRPKPPFDPSLKEYRRNRAKLLREEARAEKKTL